MDLALALGERELEALREERIHDLSDLAKQRGLAMRQAFLAPPGDDVEAFRERLRRMWELQDTLIKEARAMHATLRELIKDVKAQAKRMNGYGQTRRRPGECRFISKHG
jgi:hypothetical protein